MTRLPRYLRSLLPSPRDYALVRRTWRADLLAGVTVGIVALPLALGFGISSGAGAAAGLVTAIVAGVVAAVFGVWAARARPALLSKLAPIISRLAGKTDAPADAVRQVEERIYAVPRWPLSRIGRVAAWEVAFHIAAVAEVFVVLRLLIPDIALSEAFLFETAGRFVTVAFKFVPYRLGIDEIGSGAVANALGMPPATGVTLALVRRLRIIVLNAFGLVRLMK